MNKPFAPAANNSQPETLYTLVRRGDLDVHEVEQQERTAVEVSVQWNTSVLHVAHLEEGQGFRLVSAAPKATRSGSAMLGGLASCTGLLVAAAATGSVAVGAAGAALALAGAGTGIAMERKAQRESASGSHFVVDAEQLGGAEALELVRFEAGSHVLLVPAGGTVKVDGENAVQPTGNAVKLAAGPRYTLELGGLTVRVKLVARARKVRGALRTDRTALGAGLGALLLVGSLVAAGFSASGDSLMASPGEEADRLAELRGFAQRADARQPEQQQPEQANNSQGAAQPEGHRAANTEGRAGDHRVESRSGRMAVQRRDQPLQLSQHDARDQVANRGVFAALGGPAMAEVGGQGPHSPFGGLLESGLDSRSANGGFEGDIGAANGFDGLGRVGMGEGGGGDGQGTVGLRNDGLLGGRPNRGNAGVVGRLVGGPGRDTHGPLLRPGVPDTDPGIDREVIRRVVLRNLGQVTNCHEQGLMQNPALAGRVVVRFVINGNGSVLGAAVGDSNLSVPSVAQCIANAVRRWNFPAIPGGGVAQVSYPFNLMAPVH